MKKEMRKRLAWMLPFVMLLGCVCNAGAVRGTVRTAASSGFKDISTDTESGPGASAPAEDTEWKIIDPTKEYTDPDGNLLYEYEGLEVDTYQVRATGKEVVVRSEIVERLVKIFDTKDVYRNWIEGGYQGCIEIDNNIAVESTLQDEKGLQRRTIIVKENREEKIYEVSIEEIKDDIKIRIQKASAGPEYIVSVSGDTITITRSVTNEEMVATIKKEGEKYNLVITKKWKDEKRFELAREVKPSVTPEPSTVPSTEPSAGPATSTPVPTDTTPPTGTPTVTSTVPPTEEPTEVPTEKPTETPTEVPTNTPVSTPINTPTVIPTSTPTEGPKQYEKAIGQSINVKKEYGKKSEISDWSKYKKYISVNKKKGTIRIEKYKKGEIKVGVSVGKKKKVLSIKIKRPKVKIMIGKGRKTVKATFSNVGKAKKVILQFYSTKKKKYVAPSFFSKCFKRKGGKFRNPTKMGKIKYRLCVIYNKKKSYSKPITK